MDLRRITFTILFYSSLGLVLSLGLISKRAIGRRYFIFHGLGTVGLSILASYIGIAWKLEVFAWIFLATLYSLLAGRYSTLSRITYVLTCLVTAWALYEAIPAVEPHYFFSHRSLYFLNSLLSVCLLGFTLSAMLLGHWYLVEPTLPIDELRRTGIAFIAAVVSRFIFATLLLVPLLSEKSEIELLKFFTSENRGIFLLMRYSWGILGPLFLCYLVWGTIKIRSTQSATGILYVAVLTVLTGEILGQFLAFVYGIPL